MLYKYNLS